MLASMQDGGLGGSPGPGARVKLVSEEFTKWSRGRLFIVSAFTQHTTQRRSANGDHDVSCVRELGRASRQAGRRRFVRGRSPERREYAGRGRATRCRPGCVLQESDPEG